MYLLYVVTVLVSTALLVTHRISPDMPASTSTIRSYMSERIQNRINPRPLTKEESRASFKWKTRTIPKIAKTTWFVRVRSILRLPKPVWLSLMKFAAIPLQSNILSEDPQYHFLPNAVAYQNQAICSFKLYFWNQVQRDALARDKRGILKWVPWDREEVGC